MTAQTSAAVSQNLHASAQPRRYSSFSSLKWEHVTLTRLRWHEYWVWAVGASASGVGGLWFSSHHPDAFTSQEAAQAAVEILHLEETEPPALEDAHLVCATLMSGPQTFDGLKTLTGLDEDQLSDALAEARSHNAIRCDAGSWKLFDVRLLPPPPPRKEITLTPISTSPPGSSDNPVSSFADYAAKQVAEMQEEIDRLTRRKAALETTLEGVRLLQAIDAPAVATQPGPALHATSFESMELVRATVKYLSIVGETKTLREIHKALIDGGWRTGAADPLDNMRRMLQRNFERSDTALTFVDNRWGLKEWDRFGVKD